MKKIMMMIAIDETVPTITMTKMTNANDDKVKNDNDDAYNDETRYCSSATL